MISQSLLELIETLKARLDEHAHEFRDSETLTRYALIDPLLRELGWDTEDPKVVRPEYRVNGKLADYVLFADGKPTIVVESKKLGQPLGTTLAQGRENVKQARQNAKSSRAKYFLLTDGRRYKLYETDKESACGSFDLRDSLSGEGCLKAFTAPSRKMVTDVPLPLPTNDGYVWEPLAEITFEKRPVKMRLPNCTKKVGIERYRTKEVGIKRWNDLLTETTCWLVDNNCLDRNSLCIMRRGNPKNTTVVVSSKPQPKADKVSGVYVRTDYTPENCVLNAIAIIKHVGQDPAQFSVRFS